MCCTLRENLDLKIKNTNYDVQRHGETDEIRPPISTIYNWLPQPAIILEPRGANVELSHSAIELLLIERAKYEWVYRTFCCFYSVGVNWNFRSLAEQTKRLLKVLCAKSSVGLVYSFIIYLDKQKSRAPTKSNNFWGKYNQWLFIYFQ